MAKRSMMGSSKYEFDLDRIDKDFSDRNNFYHEYQQQWDKELIGISVKCLHDNLININRFKEIHIEYKKRNYTFRFTFEGYQERVILFLESKLQNKRIRRKLINPSPNPRYDDVYFEGIKKLNEELD